MPCHPARSEIRLGRQVPCTEASRPSPPGIPPDGQGLPAIVMKRLVAITTEVRAEEIYGHADTPLDLSRSIEPQVIAHAHQDDAMGLYVDPATP